MTYTYDAPRHVAPPMDGITERGPPATYDHATYDAGASWSHGAEVRSERPAPAADTDYEHPGTLAQVAWAAGTTAQQAEINYGSSFVFERSRVAAETGGFDVAAAEEAGGHTLARHVGMSDQALIDRNIPYASTFTDQAAAESVTAENLSANAGAISKWLAGSSPRLAIQHSMDSALGRVYERESQTFLQPSGVNTVLVRTPTGYNVLTSYPTP